MAGSSRMLTSLYESYWMNKAGSLAAMSDEWADVMLDINNFAAHHIIIDKNGHATPLVLNEAQQAVVKLLLPFFFTAVPEPVDVVILKSRQMGISTVLVLIEKYIAARKRNINIIHVFPTEDLAKDFWIEKGEPLWEGSHPDILPDAYVTTTPTPYIKIRKFAGKDMGVNIKFDGGNSKSAGRSTTNQIIIGDEWAFQENVKRLERGLLATRPKTGLALTAYISTASGMNFFYDAWKQAHKKESRIYHLFLPWHMLKEYERDPTPESRFYDLNRWKPNSNDVKLINIFKEAGYPKESWLRKLVWYEDTLVNEAKGDIEFMHQEYPSNDEEPFESTGRPVFPMKVIKYWLEQEHPYTPIAMVEQSQATTPSSLVPTSRRKTEITFGPVDMSGVRQYIKPVAGHKYSIGVDTSTNVVAGDYSAGMVVDETTMEEVCSFSLQMDQNDLAELVVNLAKYYNKARIVPERNMGELFIESVTSVLGYYNVYIDPKLSTSKKVVYGIHISQNNKREAIRRLRFLMNNNIYKAHDKIFMEQLLHYSYRELPSGDWRAEAIGTDENGEPNHDDSVASKFPWVLSLNFNRWKHYFDSTKKGTKNAT